MKVKKTLTLVLIVPIVFGIVMTACSKESQLVGEWQSTTQESIHLSIAKNWESSDGYHYGFSCTERGTTYANGYWKIKDNNEGTILRLAWKARIEGGGPWADQYASQYRVKELTSDKFVVEWGLGNEPLRVVEFRRVK